MSKLYYLEKMLEEILWEKKPGHRLNEAQIYTLCLYKRELNRINNEKDSDNSPVSCSSTQLTSEQ